MNFRDYQKIMRERNLISTPEAEQFLVNAIRCQDNILALGDSDNVLKETFVRMKDRCIQRAIDASWEIDSMGFSLLELGEWENKCMELRQSLEPTIVAVTATKRPFQTYPESLREFHRQMEAEKYEE